MVKRVSNVAAGLLLFLVGALIVLTQFGRFAMHGYRIPSSAMEPTLHCARPGAGCEASEMDRILVPRWLPFWTPSRGDIVAFETPPEARVRCGSGGVYVKRLIGLPGETVSERGGYIFVDGKPLQESYVKGGRRGGETRTWRVPPGGYFVLGDNRSQSCDSRVWGSVPNDNLIGPVVTIAFPFDRIGRP